MYKKWSAGFTIVELLIVIVVIAILAAITVVAYNGVQARAQKSKVDSDLAVLEKAITAARLSTGERPLRYVTNSIGTSSNCVFTDSAIDIADKAAAEGCWTAYLSGLTAISDKSGVDVRGLVDPWGRPYYIDENEGEGAGCGNRDIIGSFPRPRVRASWARDVQRVIPYITPGC